MLALICTLLLFKSRHCFLFFNNIFCICFVGCCLKFTVYNLFLCFNFSKHIYNQISIFCCVNTIKILYVLYSCYYLQLLLLQHGDIESNSGPKKEQIKHISCCHWTVNSLLAHDMCKISQIEAYNSLDNHDFICISETFFDSSILEKDQHFQLNGYQLIRAYHPSNTKRGGDCISRKESLGVCLLKLSNLSQCIVCEVFLQNCKGYIGVVYRSPSQDNIEFESFLSEFD